MSGRDERVKPSPGCGVLEPHSDWRSEWTADRRVWWWYGTFEHDVAVQRLAQRARDVLQPGGPVDVVPARWLHLTLAEVGYVADLPRQLAYEAAHLAQNELVEVSPIDLDVGPVDLMPGAVVLRVLGTGLDELHDQLVSALPDELPRRPVQMPFQPHVSIAYVNRGCSSSDVISVPFADHDPVRTRLDHISLVEVVRDQGHYRWTPRCRVALSGGRPGHLTAVG